MTDLHDAESQTDAIVLHENLGNQLAMAHENKRVLADNALRMLEALYRMYEAAGDERGVNSIQVIGETMQEVATALEEYHKLHMGMVAASKELREQRDRIAGEHEALREAINHHDRTHPAIDELMDEIYEDADEILRGQIYDELMMDDYYMNDNVEAVEESFHENLLMAGFSQREATAFINIVNGVTDLADDQKAPLRHILSVLARAKEQSEVSDETR